jgi:hypothetical protein
MVAVAMVVMNSKPIGSQWRFWLLGGTPRHAGPCGFDRSRAGSKSHSGTRPKDALSWRPYPNSRKGVALCK